jgi:putative DNA primase/helicase
MSITETNELVTPEIPWGVAEAIASWRRIIDKTVGDKQPNFRRAALELMRLAEAQAEALSRQIIVDALAEMADTAGVGPDAAQEMMQEGVSCRNVPGSSGLISQCAANIAPERVDWLWPARIARGKHTCIGGEPGDGKSQLTVFITAVITSGGDWPCGEGRSPIGNVIILSAEDGAADTIVPRLMAAGADRRRVHLVSAVRDDDRRRAFSLQRDIEALERKIEAIGDVALVIIDPVSSYLGKTDSHKNGEVRGVLEPLSEMAERLRVAILSVTHFSKGSTGNTMKALHRFIGSIAFTGAPRCAFAVVADAQNSRTLFLHAKNNLAARPQGLAYRLEQCIVGEPESGIVASRIAWDSEPVSITADQALAAEAGCNAETRTAKAEAMEFLRAALADGPVPAIEINRMAREHGLASKAVRSAREALGVKIERDGFGPGSKSLWSISGDP